MKSLRGAWDDAEQWVDRYNVLLAAGMANADAETLRGELDSLFTDILTTVENRARVNALRHHRNWGGSRGDIVDDMLLLYRWIGRR